MRPTLAGRRAGTPSSPPSFFFRVSVLIHYPPVSLAAAARMFGEFEAFDPSEGRTHAVDRAVENDSGTADSQEIVSELSLKLNFANFHSGGA